MNSNPNNEPRLASPYHKTPYANAFSDNIRPTRNISTNRNRKQSSPLLSISHVPRRKKSILLTTSKSNRSISFKQDRPESQTPTTSNSNSNEKLLTLSEAQTQAQVASSGSSLSPQLTVNISVETNNKTKSNNSSLTSTSSTMSYSTMQAIPTRNEHQNNSNNILNNASNNTTNNTTHNTSKVLVSTKGNIKDQTLGTAASNKQSQQKEEIVLTPSEKKAQEQRRAAMRKKWRKAIQTISMANRAVAKFEAPIKQRRINLTKKLSNTLFMSSDVKNKKKKDRKTKKRRVCITYCSRSFSFTSQRLLH